MSITMRITIAVTVAFAFVFAVAAAPAHAEPGSGRAGSGHHKARSGSRALARAMRLNRKGLAAYRKRDYDVAIAAFDEAYALTGAPGVLYNLAQAHRLAGHCAAAFADYERFVRARPHAPEAKIARRHMKELKRCAPARLSAAATSGPASGAARHEHAPASSRPAASKSTRHEHAPAHHHKAASASGTKIGPPAPPVSTAPGASVSSPPPAATLTQPERRPDSGRTKRLAGIGVGVAGVALTAASVVFGAQASSAASDLTSRYRKGGTWDKSAGALQSRGQHRQTLSIICGVAGVAGLVGGGLLYYLGHTDAERQADGGARLSVAPLPGGAALVYAGSL